MKKALALIGLIISPALAIAQGTFQNLNFELARLSGYPPGTLGTNVPAGAGLPGWGAFDSSPSGGINQLAEIWYNGVSLGGAMISVINNNAASYFGAIQGFIQGSYSALLFGGGPGNDTSSIINQTGLVPSGTMSLQVKMSWGLMAPAVALGGQTVNLVPLATFPSYTLYGGDVSAFAGQVATLSFTEPPPPSGQVPPSYLLLDDIAFSPQAVPEPGLTGWSALGAFLLGWRVLGRRRCQCK